jgi:hypothetical protein
MPVIAVAVLVTAAVAFAAPSSPQASCTATQKSQRQAALTAYRKAIGPARKAFFAHHHSPALRKAFLLRQRVRLKVLIQASGCTVGTTTINDSARLAQLKTYAASVYALGDLFDPTTSDDADTAIGTVEGDAQACSDDPTLCPVDPSEYQDAATAANAAVTPISQLATKLAAITPPSMTTDDYDPSANDCGVELTTVADAQKNLHDVNAAWATTLTGWGNTYATGKSPDFSTSNYDPGVDTIDSDPHQALVDWAVMVGFYWDALAAKPDVTSPPALPSWIGALRDEECPSS